MSDRAGISIPGIVRPASGEAVLLPMDNEQWQESFYRDAILHRVNVKQLTSDGAPARDAARAVQLALCRQPGGKGFLYWLITFATMLEPRNDADQSELPFVPYPRQAELALTIAGCMSVQGPGPESSLLVEKARAVGATWIDAAYNVWSWLFEPRFTALIISRTEEQVDSKGDPSSYFWKMRFILRNLPTWMMPTEFEVGGKHDNHRKLINPENDSIVTGATTTEDAGRAGRYKRVTIDEGAFIDGFGPIWNNLANVTYHRFTYSSANTRNGMDFFNLRFGREGYHPPVVFTYRWDEVPGRDAEWLSAMRDSMHADEFQREVMLNYMAGSGDWVYPMAQTIQPGNFPFVPGWPVRVIIDDGYDDDFAIVWVQKDVAHRRSRVIAAYSNNHKPLRFYGHLMLGQPSTEFTWTEHERDLMAWIREYRVFSAVYYGDRHGDATDLTSGKSPFGVLAEEFGIVVVTTGDPNQNSIKHRRDALAELLPTMDIDQEHGAPLVLEAIRYARFPRIRSGSQPTAEARNPVHDGTSHYRSAMEYFAINERLEFALDGFGGQPRTRERNTLSGFNPYRMNGRRNGRGSREYQEAAWTP